MPLLVEVGEDSSGLEAISATVDPQCNISNLKTYAVSIMIFNEDTRMFYKLLRISCRITEQQHSMTIGPVSCIFATKYVIERKNLTQLRSQRTWHSLYVERSSAAAKVQKCDVSCKFSG